MQQQFIYWNKKITLELAFKFLRQYSVPAAFQAEVERRLVRRHTRRPRRCRGRDSTSDDVAGRLELSALKKMKWKIQWNEKCNDLKCVQKPT